MKTKINRKTLQAKLNHGISTIVKSVINTDSKKISKSIKKASKVIAKAVTKTMNKKETVKNIFAKKYAPKKTAANKNIKAMAAKKSFPKAAHKIKKATPAKVLQKTKEIPVTSETKTDMEIIPAQ